MLVLALSALALASSPVLPRARTPSAGAQRHGSFRLAASSLADLKVYELKAVCRAKGLKVSGRKAELIARIEAAPLGIAPKPDTKKRARKITRKQQMQPLASAPALAPTAVDADRDVPASRSSLSLNPMNAPSRPHAAAVATNSTVLVDVMDRVKVEEVDHMERRAARRAARRTKLAGYFSEEYTKLVGELETNAGSAFAAAFGVEEQVSIGGGAALLSIGYCEGACGYQQSVHERGRRLAWCKSFDTSRGIGVLVDMDNRTELSIRRIDLHVSASVAERSRVLYPGEFVEYEPEGAEQSRKAGTSVSADGGVGVPPPVTGRVSGILGWPLMCESVSRAALTLVAHAE